MLLVDLTCGKKKASIHIRSFEVVVQSIEKKKTKANQRSKKRLSFINESVVFVCFSIWV